MSGHSHWSKIKYKKGTTDTQKGKAFSKMARLITIAAREKGGDPTTNPKLRLAIEGAKSINLPKDNIERAIKRGTGEIAGGELQEILFEAYGPGSIALIIEGITDNKNRALAQIKHILSENNGKLAGGGSVKWLFVRKGVITINIEDQTDFKNKEELELKIIDSGAENFTWENSNLEAYTTAKDLQDVENKLRDLGIKIESATLDWVAKDRISVPEKERKAAENLFLSLDENDAVQEIYSNLKT